VRAEPEVLAAVESALAPVPVASEQEWAAAQRVPALDQEWVRAWVPGCSAVEYFPCPAPRRFLDHSNSRSITPRALAPRARDDCAHP
jgi:hypothetical protein